MVLANPIFGKDITKYTVIYGVYIRFWLILHNLLEVQPKSHIPSVYAYQPNICGCRLPPL